MNYKLFKYWWWYHITINKNPQHKLLDYRTYYYGRGWWLLDSKYMAHKLQCRFRLCVRLFEENK